MRPKTPKTSKTSKSFSPRGSSQVVEPIAVKKLPAPSIAFPPAWPWFVDEIVPGFVKSEYSPRESWRDKPFSKEDVRFFSKGVIELSEMFTEERPSRIPAYFQHPKFRSAYLLYFLPLQMAKVVTLLQMHEAALEAALDHGRKTGTVRIADLGAGPGTASLALLLTLLQIRGEIPPIELLWFDTNRGVMEDGEKLALSLAEQFPKLRGKLSVKIHATAWWEAPAQLKDSCSLIFMGHVLNEAKDLPQRFLPKKDELMPESSDEHDESEMEEPSGEEKTRRSAPLESVWEALLEKADGGGILIVEPAAKGTSQYLSRLRNRMFESQAIPESATSLWGPCPHAETCPLSYGRDWCHFSVPTRVPGKWFAEFSKALGSERQWLKFSYLWLSTPDYRSEKRNPNLRLVISDPLGKGGDVLLCEPERPGRISTEDLGPVWRGDTLLLK